MVFTPNVNPTFIKQPNMGVVQITTGTTIAANGWGNIVTVYTGGSSNGSKVVGLSGVSFFTSAAVDVQWGLYFNSSTFYAMGTVAVSANAGSSSTINAVNMLNATNCPQLTLDSDGNPFLFLRSSQDALSVRISSNSPSTSWVSSAVLNFVATVSDF